MNTTDLNNATVNVTGQVEVVAVSAATKKLKKAALFAAGAAAAGVIAYHGYKLFKKTRVAIEVVADPTTDNATETEAAAPAETAQA